MIKDFENKFEKFEKKHTVGDLIEVRRALRKRARKYDGRQLDGDELNVTHSNPQQFRLDEDEPPPPPSRSSSSLKGYPSQFFTQSREPKQSHSPSAGDRASGETRQATPTPRPPAYEYSFVPPPPPYPDMPDPCENPGQQTPNLSAIHPVAQSYPVSGEKTPDRIHIGAWATMKMFRAWRLAFKKAVAAASSKKVGGSLRLDFSSRKSSEYRRAQQ